MIGSFKERMKKIEMFWLVGLVWCEREDRRGCVTSAHTSHDFLDVAITGMYERVVRATYGLTNGLFLLVELDSEYIISLLPSGAT